MVTGNSHACRNWAAFLSIIFLTAQIWLCVRPAIGPQPAGRQFLGFPHLPTDHYAYMMYAEQTRSQGAVLTKNLFTTAPQEGRFLMLGLAAIGAVESLIPAAAPVVWHAFRIVVLALFCVVLWHLCLTIFGIPGRALATHVFVLFSGGMEWLVKPVFGQSITGLGFDWTNFLDNPWNFSIFYASTNLVWAIPATILAALVLMQIRRHKDAAERSVAERPASDQLAGFVSGLGFAVLWFIHPYSAIVWGVAFTISVIFPPRLGRGWLQAATRSVMANQAALAGPLIVAAFLAWTSDDPVVAASNAQTGLWKLNYPVYLYPIVYGPWFVLPLFLTRQRPCAKERRISRLRWPLIWFASGFVLTLNPLITGAKFQSSMFVPLALLEMAGLFAILDRLPRRSGPDMTSKHRRIEVVIIASFLLVTSMNSIGGLVTDINPPETRMAATASTQHLAALDFLRDQPMGGILCDPWEGMIVPWKTGKPVFVGQWFLSTRYGEKARLVRWFFSGQGKPEQLAGFLNSAGISYVIHGPREAESGPMPKIDGLEMIYRQGDREIWRWKGTGAVAH